ncbi:MAG: hypothetical protein IPO37_07150 [Saprospiraceae bacterium]|nr:hypothetical protein [Saprospiraceae bacterium]
MWTELGKVLESTIGSVPLDHRKKKRIKTKFGEIEVSNSNDEIQEISGQKFSPFLQEN